MILISIFPITRRTMPYIFTDDELRRVFAEPANKKSIAN